MRKGQKKDKRIKEGKKKKTREDTTTIIYLLKKVGSNEDKNDANVLKKRLE